MRSARVFFAAAAALVALTGCSSSGSSSGSAASGNGASGGGTQSLTVATLAGSVSDLPLHVAQAQGFFSQEGLNVQFVDFKDSPDSIAAVLGGSVDLTQASGLVQMKTDASLAGTSKALLKVYEVQSAPLWQIYLSPKLGISAGQPLTTQLKALAGKAISIPGAGGEGTAVMDYLLKQAGVNPDSVNQSPLGVGASALAAFKAGQVQGVITIPPVSYLLKSAGAVQVFAMSSQTEFPKLQRWDQTAYIATRGALAADPGKFMKFVDAMNKATVFIKDPANTDQVLKDWAASVPSSASAELSEALAPERAALSAGKVDCVGVANAAAFGVSSGLITSSQVQTCEQLTWPEMGSYLVKQ